MKKCSTVYTPVSSITTLTRQVLRYLRFAIKTGLEANEAAFILTRATFLFIQKKREAFKFFSFLFFTARRFLN
jgi:hypothetical protein